MLEKPIVAAALALSLFAASTGAADGGSIGLGRPTVVGSQYTIPVVLSGAADQVAALNFELSYDPAVFRPVAASSGPNALQANKIVNANMPEPGKYIVVMMGLNQETVRPGEVATLVMERVSAPEDGASDLSIDRPTLSTAQGLEIPSRGERRTITMDGATAEEPEPAEETPTPEVEPDQSGEPEPAESAESPRGIPAPRVPGMLANNKTATAKAGQAAATAPAHATARAGVPGAPSPRAAIEAAAEQLADTPQLGELKAESIKAGEVQSEVEAAPVAAPVQLAGAQTPLVAAEEFSADTADGKISTLATTSRGESSRATGFLLPISAFAAMVLAVLWAVKKKSARG
jgi:hypothetical protein